MHNLAPLIYDLTIMLGLAGIVVLLFQRIHQPIVLGYIVAGIIVGPHTPPYQLIKDVHNIEILSELGVIFLMFSLGLEFSFHKLKQVGFSASVTGFIEVIGMMLIGFLVGHHLLGWSYYNSLFLGAALSISSTTIIIKAIDELGLKTKRFAELIFGVLIVEDLLAILLLVGLSTLVTTRSVFSYDMLSAVIKLILVVGSWFLFGYFLVPPLFRGIARYINAETLTIISVALCLFLVTLAAYFNYSSALGAFIMGSILAETVLGHRIEHLIQPIRDIFAAVFFISVGMLINPMSILENWPIVILLVVVTIIGKILTTSTAAFLTGQSVDTSMRVGFSMAQIGEFSFIIAALCATLKVSNNQLYPLIVAVSAVTTFTTPYLIRLSSSASQFVMRHLPERTTYFLNSYTAWVYRSQTAAKGQATLGTPITRLVANGIMLALIFAITHFTVFHKLDFSEESIWMNNLCLLFSIMLASPFIWGMLFSYKKLKMPFYAEGTFNPAVFIIWLLTLLELTVLALVYFHSWATILFLVIVATIFIIFAYRHLERSYHWFENQLIKNLNNHTTDQLRYEELAPWDTHLVEIEVGERSVFAGMTLAECQIRQLYGVNIVAICHGSRIIAAPRGDERIVAHDKLIVLGNDKQLESFTKQIEAATSYKDEAVSFLDNFTLKGILLEEGHPLIGKTIRSSTIRERVNGLVVGLERDNARILNPDPEMVLKMDDLLLVVGETQKVMKI